MRESLPTSSSISVAADAGHDQLLSNVTADNSVPACRGSGRLVERRAVMAWLVMGQDGLFNLVRGSITMLYSTYSEGFLVGWLDMTSPWFILL